MLQVTLRRSTVLVLFTSLGLSYPLDRCFAQFSTPPDSTQQGSQESQSNTVDLSPTPSPFWANHFSLFQGSSLTRPTSYQPDIAGEPDISRPIAFRNFTTLGWQSSGGAGIAGTFAWAAQAGNNAGLVLKDPTLRLYHSQLSTIEWLDWYADVRFHPAAGPESQLQGRTLGIQSFHAITLQANTIPVWGGFWISARWNHYRIPSNSPLWELYIAPNLHWGINERFILSLSLEENAGIWADFTEGGTYRSSDPWYFEAALTWRINPTFEIFPLFNLPLTSQTRLQSVALGVGFSWNLL
jgi:hypothetical protein